MIHTVRNTLCFREIPGAWRRLPCCWTIRISLAEIASIQRGWGHSSANRFSLCQRGGRPSTAIGIEELFMTGVRNFIRVSTCGGMALPVMGGDLVIATGAIRMEGTTREYLPIEFPAVADFELTGCVVDAAREGGYRYHTGVVQCKDSFYGQHSPGRMPVSYDLEQKWEAWLRGGTLATEMESAALYIVCQSLGAKAACILNTIWNQERRARGMDDSESHDTMRGIRVAVEAIKLHIQREREQKL